MLQVTTTEDVHTRVGAATPEDYAAKMWTMNTEHAIAPLRSVLSEDQVSAFKSSSWGFMTVAVGCLLFTSPLAVRKLWKGSWLPRAWQVKVNRWGCSAHLGRLAL